MVIELNVLWITDEQEKLEQAGIDIDFKDCVVKKHTFYQIAFIHPGEDGFCQIGSNGETFFIKESYESVKKKVDEQVNFKWN